MKKCSRCKNQKSYSDFNKSKQSKDGYGYWCIQCNKDYYTENKEHHINVCKEWKNRNPLKRKEYRQNYRKKHSEKQKEIRKKTYLSRMKEEIANSTLNNAVYRDKIKKPVKCSRCEYEGLIQGHHEDYDKPLDVIWLCRKCHLQVHGKRIHEVLE